MLNQPPHEALSALPYQDEKPVGAPDFYFAINATFRFIQARCGESGLRRYWTHFGEKYMAPVWNNWRAQGLSGITAYWQAFFRAEPGGAVEVTQEVDHVRLDVQTCPAIRHLREHNREIVPNFCQHCYFVSEAAAQKAGFTVRVIGGNGSCRQTFHPANAGIEPQRLEDIRDASHPQPMHPQPILPQAIPSQGGETS